MASPLAFLLVLFLSWCLALKSPPIRKYFVLFLRISSSRSACEILFVGGANAAPMVIFDDVLVFIVTISIAVSEGCMVCSTRMLLCVAIRAPPLGEVVFESILSFL